MDSLLLQRFYEPYSAQASNDLASQRIIFSNLVIKTLKRNRQRNNSSLEAGGQLFGTVSPDVVSITHASSPSLRDLRTRYSFQSSAQLAQRRIRRFAVHGIHYLGEWHTHPQRFPLPSHTDRRAMESLHKLSKLSVTEMILVIVSSTDNVCSWYVESSNQKGRVLSWQLTPLSFNQDTKPVRRNTS